MVHTLLQSVKKFLGKNLTKKIRPIFHGIKGILASVVYFFPSNRLYLIGISGTKGKTTTAVFIGKLLNSLGQKTGYISSALIYDGQKEYLNKYKMGMLDSFVSQKIMRQMVKNKCKFVVFEATSEGLEQHRHWGMKKFDLITFLNIYPEHIEAHGSFANYEKAKSILPRNLKKNGVYIHNDDLEQQNYFQEILSFVPKNLVSTFQFVPVKTQDYQVLRHPNNLFLDLNLNGDVLETQLISEMEIFDLAVAIKAVENALLDFYANEPKNVMEKSRLQIVGFDLDNPLQRPINQKVLQTIVAELTTIPGRMEWVIFQGVTFFPKKTTEVDAINLSVLVDYAHEPESMKKLLETLDNWKQKNFFDVVIHLVSCDGAGRDDWKKPMLGSLSKQLADFSILTTDNFGSEDDPEEILSLLEKDLDKSELDKSYFKEVNRKQAMLKALELSKLLQVKQNTRVLIVSTGVGSEQGLTQPDGVMEWDERKEWLKSVKATS